MKMFDPKISGITDANKEALNHAFDELDELQTHVLSSQTGIDSDVILGLLMYMLAVDLCDMVIYTYHHGLYDDLPHISESPFLDGYPKLPWYCDECEEEVESYDELEFDYVARLKEPTHIE